MRRIFTFSMGLLTGGALIYFTMNYHLIRSQEGLHLIPKASAQFSSTYADIRDYRVADWAQNADLAAALVNANRRDLLDNAINDTLQNGIDRLLNRDTR